MRTAILLSSATAEELKHEFLHCVLCAVQAVIAAAEARQPPADFVPESSLPKPSQKPIGPKKPPTTTKTATAKPIFIKKRASADPTAALDQVTTIVCDVVTVPAK